MPPSLARRDDRPLRALVGAGTLLWSGAVRQRTGFALVPGLRLPVLEHPAPGGSSVAAFGHGGQLVEVVPGPSLVGVVLSASPTDPRTEADAYAAQPEDCATMVNRVIIPAVR
jgi:hypothetical protein